MCQKEKLIVSWEKTMKNKNKIVLVFYMGACESKLVWCQAHLTLQIFRDNMNKQTNQHTAWERERVYFIQRKRNKISMKICARNFHSHMKNKQTNTQQRERFLLSFLPLFQFAHCTFELPGWFCTHFVFFQTQSKVNEIFIVHVSLPACTIFCLWFHLK